MLLNVSLFTHYKDSGIALLPDGASARTWVAGWSHSLLQCCFTKNSPTISMQELMVYFCSHVEVFMLQSAPLSNKTSACGVSH